MPVTALQTAITDPLWETTQPTQKGKKKSQRKETRREGKKTYSEYLTVCGSLFQEQNTLSGMRLHFSVLV